MSAKYLLLAAAVAGRASAHVHHNITEIDTSVPFDSLIYMHMSLQAFVWAILFPVGMVLGLAKSKYHVPLQSVGVVLTFAGSWLGHHHDGRQFPDTVHGTMAKIISLILIIQASAGIFLKLHILEDTVRPWVKRLHGPLGMAFPVIGWTQMLFGITTAFGLCRNGELGQCAAHYIMGSAFIAYAAILVIMLHLGGAWLARRGWSQEMLDSSVIMVWGIINTFTEHHGGPWTHKDMQHTMLGVLWWAGGMLGVYLSRKGKRSFVPAVIIIMTGWGMSAHEQALMISSKIHALFGYALIAAGVLRLVEICFVLADGPTPSPSVRVFQHLPPYLLVLGGTLFMSATDEEMHAADGAGIDHVTYALADFSMSFLIYLVITALVGLYMGTGKNAQRDWAGEAEAAAAGVDTGTGSGRREGEGYRKIEGRESDGPEAFELEERESDEDATKMGREDEVDWVDRRAVRL
ncbi:hypothetical protein Q5752_001829 [Cryptotrichosporon argae]